MHDNTPDKQYSFRSTNRLKVGELAVCKNKYGYTYGIVVEARKTSYEEAKRYTGVVSKANAHMFAKLSPYDRATIIFKNTEDLETAIREFNFADIKAATAFLYNEAGASYVNTYTEYGVFFINAYKDAYNEEGTWVGFDLSLNHCLG